MYFPARRIIAVRLVDTWEPNPFKETKKHMNHFYLIQWQAEFVERHVTDTRNKKTTVTITKN